MSIKQQRQRLARVTGLSLATLLLASVTLVAAIGATGTTPTASAANTGSCMTFKEVSFQICGRFLQYWNSHGGLAQQGFPISAAFDEQNAAPPAGDGKVHTVQYFQRARFEYHTENAYPNDVLLGLLGREQYQAKYGSKAPVSVQPGKGHCSPFYAAGSHDVCGAILDYYNNNGGLTQDGYPISDLIQEQNAPPPAGDGKVHLVQYFERARFELHDATPATPVVLLGLLGSEQKGKKYPNGTPAGGPGPAAINNNPAPTPTPTPAPPASPPPTANASNPLLVGVQEYLVPGTRPSATVIQVLAVASIYNPTNHDIAVGQDTFFLTTKDGSVYQTSSLIYSDPTFGLLAMRGQVLHPGQQANGFMLFIIDRGPMLDQFVFFDGNTKLVVNFVRS